MLYQLTFLSSPELVQEEGEVFFEKIEALIKEKGEILAKEKLEKIKLAYPIEKKNEAFLASLDFKTQEDEIEDLKRKIKEEKNILRYLLIKKKEEITSKEKREIEKLKKLKTKKINLEKPKGEKVEFEKIEEKLKKLV